MLQPPRIGVVIDLPRLGEPKPTLRAVVQLAKTINRPIGLLLLGQLNLFLALAALKDGLDDAEGTGATETAQRLLVRNTISERRLNQLRAHLGPARLANTALFHRAQLLAAIKLVALFGDPTRGNRLASREDLEVLAELALAINSLLDFGPFPSGAPGYLDLAAQLAPGKELQDFPRIDHAFVRNDHMLGRLLQDQQHRPGARHLEQLFVFLTGGFNFDAFRDMTFGVFAYCQSLRTDSLGAFQSRAFLNPHGAESVFAGPLLEQFLTSLAVSIDELPDLIGPLHDERSLLLDVMPFRIAPIWRVRPDHYLCIDPYFVIDKLSSGFYWAVNRALDTDERTLEFSRLWGRLVEHHVQTVLEYAAPAGPGPIERATRAIANPHYDGGDEAFDAVLLEGEHAVVFQVKGTFVKAEARYSGRRKSFFKGVAKTFGNRPGAAVEQLIRNIRVTFGLPHPKPIACIPVRDIRCVWPVVIVLDPILDFGPVLWPLVERFWRVTSRMTLQEYKAVRPVVFMQLEDLEVIAEHIRAGDFTLVECLREKLGHDREHRYSFSEFYWGQFSPVHRLAFRRNAAVADKYKEMTDDALDRFQSGAYKDCAVTEYGAVFRRR